MFDSLFDPGAPPQRQIADFDPYAKELMDRHLAESRAPVESKFGKIDQNLATGQEMYGKLSGGMSNAIRSKYAGKVQADVTKLRDFERLNLRKNQVETLRKAQHAVAAKKAIETDAMSALMEANTARETARAQAIGSMMQFTGAVGGFASGGGFSKGGGGGVSGGGAGQGAGSASLYDYNNPGLQQGVQQSRGYRQSLMDRGSYYS